MTVTMIEKTNQLSNLVSDHNCCETKIKTSFWPRLLMNSCSPSPNLELCMQQAGEGGGRDDRFSILSAMHPLTPATHLCLYIIINHLRWAIKIMIVSLICIYSKSLLWKWKELEYTWPHTSLKCSCTLQASPFTNVEIACKFLLAMLVVTKYPAVDETLQE